MSAQATARIEPRFDSSSPLDFSQIRDEVVRAYQPATAEESLLANQIARAWFRLQRYYDLEAELMDQQRLPELFDTDLARFKALNSAIAGAERMWRQAIAEFQRARRRSAGNPPRIRARGCPRQNSPSRRNPPRFGRNQTPRHTRRPQLPGPVPGQSPHTRTPPRRRKSASWNNRRQHDYSAFELLRGTVDW